MPGTRISHLLFMKIEAVRFNFHKIYSMLILHRGSILFAFVCSVINGLELELGDTTRAFPLSFCYSLGRFSATMRICFFVTYSTDVITEIRSSKPLCLHNTNCVKNRLAPWLCFLYGLKAQKPLHFALLFFSRLAYSIFCMNFINAVSCHFLTSLSDLFTFFSPLWSL